MTPKQTLLELRKAGKPIVRSHFYRLISILGIKPLGSSRPQQYPADTVERLAVHLGISGAAVTEKKATPLPADSSRRTGKLVSVAQLRAAKPSKKKGGK